MPIAPSTIPAPAGDTAEPGRTPDHGGRTRAARVAAGAVRSAPGEPGVESGGHPSPDMPVARGGPSGAAASPAAPPVGPALDGAGAGGAAPAPRESRPGADAVAALPGGRDGRGIPPGYESYVRALRQRIQERLVYPQVAVRRRLEGAVELELELDAAGRLVHVGAVDRAGAAMLRDAAVRAVRDATPFPFPAHLAPRALLIRLPVVFELR
jgi:protein TonB